MTAPRFEIFEPDRPKPAYSEEQKRHAVAMVVADGRTAAAVSRELGVGASSVRRWLSEHRAQEWADQVTPHFDWLREHGFTLTEKDASSLWSMTAVYRRLPLAVLVIRDFEFQMVDVALVCASDVPLARRPLRVDGEITRVAMCSLLLWRRAPEPERLFDQIADGGLSPSQVDGQLAFWADILRTYGQDFLAGDPAVLDLTHPVVRYKHRKHKKGPRTP